jgi:hypothetical protein
MGVNIVGDIMSKYTDEKLKHHMTREEFFRQFTNGKCNIFTIVFGCILKTMLEKDIVTYLGKKITSVNIIGMTVIISFIPNINCYESQPIYPKKPVHEWDCDKETTDGHMSVGITLEDHTEYSVDLTGAQYKLENSIDGKCYAHIEKFTRAKILFGDSDVEHDNPVLSYAYASLEEDPDVMREDYIYNRQAETNMFHDIFKSFMKKLAK